MEEPKAQEEPLHLSLDLAIETLEEELVQL